MPRFNLLKILLFYILLVLCSGGAGVVMAQENSDSDDDTAIILQFNTLLAPPSDQYVEGNFQDLARLYWALDKFDLEDKQAIEDFLVITECDLYQKYRNDDFEWALIHQATQQHIADSVSTWPTTFEIMIPLYLEKYDIKNKVFNLQEDSWFEGARKLNVNRNHRKARTCGVYISTLKGYPENIVLLLDRPFTFTEIPMEAELASLYIQESNRKYDGFPHSLKMIRYKRFAYLRLKVRIYLYKGTSRVGGGIHEKAIVIGRLDGIEIYADEFKTRLLYSKTVKKDRRVWRKRRDTEGE